METRAERRRRARTNRRVSAEPPMTDEQLNGLYLNLDALDVPEELRLGMATNAWTQAKCHMALVYYLQHDSHSEDSDELVDWSINWACGPAEFTGAMMDIAERYLHRDITFWRDTGEYDPPTTPWSHYDPEISPAKQRGQSES